jgi:hypothetical protein
VGAPKAAFSDIFLFMLEQMRGRAVKHEEKTELQSLLKALALGGGTNMFYQTEIASLPITQSTLMPKAGCIKCLEYIHLCCDV